MNGIIILEKYSFQERIKFRFNIINREEQQFNEKKIYIYKIPYINKKSVRVLIKKLKKDNIKNLAFDNKFGYEQISLLSSEYNIIDKKSVFADKLDKMLLKASKSMGIKKGSLNLGICVNEEEIDFIDRLKKLKNELKCVFLYTKSTKKTEKKADEFYKSCGIPVIIKNKISESQADILVYKNEIISKPPKSVRLVINLAKRPCNDLRCVEDVRILFPENLNRYDISDCVVNELFDLEFKIKGFVKKTLDTCT